MENILITGTGFVSSHLEEYFNKKTDTKVIKCSRGCKDGCLKLDLANFNDCAKLYWNYKFDKIFHLAAQSSVHISWNDPFETIDANINSVNNLLDVFAGKKTKLVFAGSSEIYKNTSAQITENTELDANNPYALSKLTTDKLVRMISLEKQINCTVLRLFSHTGAGHSTNFALSSFAKQLVDIKYGKQEKKIYVGNLQIRRDYSNVRDICRAYDLVSNANEYGEVYNVCSGEAYLMKDLLNKLIALANVDCEIFVDEKRIRKNDITFLCGSYKKIKDAFGWEPLIPIEQTLQELLLYWEEFL